MERITLKEILFRKLYRDFNGNKIPITEESSIREAKLGRLKSAALAITLIVTLSSLVLIVAITVLDFDPFNIFY